VRKTVWIAVTLGLLLAAAGLFAVLVSAVPSPRNDGAKRSSIDRGPMGEAQNRQV